MSDLSNPYAPQASTGPTQVDNTTGVIAELRNQSTWRLVGLGIITLGVYLAHYIRQQTQVIEKHYRGTRPAIAGSAQAIMVGSYTALFGFIVSLFYPSRELELFSNLLDRIVSVLIIIWAFKARNRLHELLDAEPKTIVWFHGFWTFFLNVLYVNYKINRVHEQADLPIPQPADSADS